MKVVTSLVTGSDDAPDPVAPDAIRFLIDYHTKKQQQHSDVIFCFFLERIR